MVATVTGCTREKMSDPQHQILQISSEPPTTMLFKVCARLEREKTMSTLEIFSQHFDTAVTFKPVVFLFVFPLIIYKNIDNR